MEYLDNPQFTELVENQLNGTLTVEQKNSLETFLKEAELAAMTVRIAQQPPRRLFLFLHWPD